MGNGEGGGMIKKIWRGIWEGIGEGKAYLWSNIHLLFLCSLFMYVDSVDFAYFASNEKYLLVFFFNHFLLV